LFVVLPCGMTKTRPESTFLSRSRRSNLIEIVCLIRDKIKLVIVTIGKRIGKEDVNILGEIVPADFDLVSGGGSLQFVNFSRLFSSVRPRA